MPCTAPSIPLLEAFRPLFTAPTWNRMLTLLRGALLARGRRTVTAALWHTGHEQDPHFSAFHQVLNRARWSPLQASRYLLKLIVETFVQVGGTLDIVIDETLEGRWGPKMRKRGHDRDSALSSHARGVEQPWVAVDRAGSRRQGAVDQAAVGLTLSVCLGHDSGGQRASRDPPQNPRAAGAPSGQSAAALAAGSADQAHGRHGLQHPGTGTPLYPPADQPDRAVALGLRAAPTASSARSAHHWTSSRCGSAPALFRACPLWNTSSLTPLRCGSA